MPYGLRCLRRRKSTPSEGAWVAQARLDSYGVVRSPESSFSLLSSPERPGLECEEEGGQIKEGRGAKGE